MEETGLWSRLEKYKTGGIDHGEETSKQQHRIEAYL